jgi:hypothetical protein
MAIIIGIVVLATTWFLSDSARVKNTLTNIVTQLTGRTLVIDGDFDFSLGRQITVMAQQVEWANPAWSNHSRMAEASHIEVSLDTWSLINPPIIISNIRASDARLEFEWTKDGKFNWWFGDEDSAESESESEPDTPGNPLALLLDQAELANIELSFLHPDLTDPLIVQVNQAQQKRDENNNLVIDIDSVIDGRPATIKGHLGPFPELLAAGAIDFALDMGGAAADIAILGKIGDLATLQDTHIEFSLRSTDVEEMLDSINIPAATTGRMELEGTLNFSDDAISSVIKGSIGEFKIDSDLQVNNLDTMHGLALTFDSSGPSAKTAGLLASLEGLPEKPYELHISARDNDEGIDVSRFLFKTKGAEINASGLLRNYPELTDSDFDLRLDIANAAEFPVLLSVENLPELPLHIDAKITSNDVNVNDTLSSHMTLGRLEADINGDLSEQAQFAGSTISFKAEMPDARVLARLVGIELTETIPASLQGDIGIEKGQLRLQKAQISIAGNTINVDGVVPIGETTAPIKLAAEIKGPDFARVNRLIDVSDLAPPLDYAFRGDIELGGSYIQLDNLVGNLGQTTLEIDGRVATTELIPTGHINLKSKGKNLSKPLLAFGIDGIPTEAFSFDTRLDFSAKGLTASDIKLAYAHNSISGSITTPLPGESGATTFDLRSEGQDFGLLLTEMADYQPADVPFSTRLVGEYEKDHIRIDKSKVTVGTATIELSGELELEPKLVAKNIRLVGQGPKMSDLGSYNGWQFTDVPFQISATMEGSGDIVAAEDLVLNVAKSDIRGKFSLDIRDKTIIDVQLKSDLLNIEAILANDAETGSASDAAEPDSPDDGRVIPVAAVPNELLGAFNAKFDIDIKKLNTRTLLLTDFRMDGTLQDSTLDIYHISGKSDEGNVQAKISLTPESAKNRLELSLQATGVIFDIPGISSADEEDHQGHSANIRISALGNGIREFAASMDGFIWVQGSERRMENLGIDKVFGDFLGQLFTAINPFAKEDPYTEIVCDQYFLEAENGVLKTAPAIFIRTDKINIASEGKIDLATEKIDFRFGTSPRRGIGLSAGDITNPFIRVVGTMSHPGIALNKTGALVEGGAAIATVGLSVVAKGLWKRWLGPRMPCEKNLQEATKIRTEKDPDFAPDQLVQ